MQIIILIFILGLYYLGLKMKTQGMISENRTQKVISYLNRIVIISPLIGLIIFALLFTTFLKGRFIDRSSHTLIVFVLWMLATSFYIEVLRQFKIKGSLSFL